MTHLYLHFFFLKKKKKKEEKYLGEAATSMSLLNSSGLLMEAMHPIIPDIEWPTKTEDFKSSSSIRAIKSLAKAS